MRRRLRVYAGNANCSRAIAATMADIVSDDYFLSKDECESDYPNKSQEYKVTIVVERVKKAGEG